MGLIFKLIPYIALPALILVSGAIGVYLIFTSREILLERYEALIYNLTQESLHDVDQNHTRHVVLSGRILGIVALLFSVGMGFATYFIFFSQSATTA